MVAVGIEELGVYCRSMAPIERKRRLGESKAVSNENLAFGRLPVQTIEEYQGSGEDVKRTCMRG